MGGRPVVVAWTCSGRRSEELARDLGGAVRIVDGPGPAPVRQFVGALRAWRLLDRSRPPLVAVVTDHFPALLVVGAWCLLGGGELIVDWRPSGRLGRWLSRAARPLLCRCCRVALAHTRAHQAQLERWGVPVVHLVDEAPAVRLASATGEARSRSDLVVLAGRLGRDEPVAEALTAAALLPHVRFALTGDPARLTTPVLAAAPPNVTFTGWLPRDEFLAALAGADAVAVFRDDPGGSAPRAALEAVGAGRPLVLLDSPEARSTFGTAAAFTTAEAGEMAAAIEGALLDRVDLAAASRVLAGRLRARRADSMAALRAKLAAPPPPAEQRARVLVLTQHSLERHCIARRNVEELLGRGFDLDVVCAEPLATPPRQGDPSRLRTHVIPIPRRRGGLACCVLEYTAFLVAALFVVSWLGLRRRYALVQSDNLPDYLVFAALVPRARGARLVLNLFELTPEIVDAQVGGRLGPLPGRVARWIEARAVAWADRVIVVSEACRDALRARGAPAEKLAVVVNTTSWTGPALSDADALDQGGYLVTHGALVERGGTHLILRALTVLPDRAARLRVVGAGDQLPALIELARELGVAERVRFTGHLPWGETLTQVRGAAAGVVAVLEDGYGQLLLPTTLLEYARLGVPAVCPRLAAIQACFPSGAVAYFRPGDPVDLALQVERLLADPERARGQAARAREVVDSLSWERMRDRYVEALGLVDPAAAAPESGLRRARREPVER
jgi:glycosyltransferase involved in cell wall biosynthesis